VLIFSTSAIGVVFLVYCSKCGFKNEDAAATCAQCGAALQISRRERRGGRRVEDECFGLPHGGIIVGLIIGIIVILWGLTQVPGLLPENFELWWLIVIVFGVLLVAGSLYRLSRR
jgi:hypothetical protein